MFHKKYHVKITIGKARWAGTNSTIKITLIDHEGKTTKEKELNKWIHKGFEYGKTDTFTISAPKDFGKFFSILF